MDVVGDGGASRKMDPTQHATENPTTATSNIATVRPVRGLPGAERSRRRTAFPAARFASAKARANRGLSKRIVCSVPFHAM